VCDGNHLFFDKLAISEREFSKNAKGGFDHQQTTTIEVETDGENPQHVAVLNAFAGNILHGTPLIAHGAEGIHGLTLSNAMHLSSWLDKAVDIPFDEELFLAELNKRRATSQKKDVVAVTFDTEGTY
jgi:hypothetical protein